ncbi:MAG: hypothetical protein ACLS51_04850 [Clostridium sp.]
MRKKLITIITYITIVTFIGFLVVLSIDQFRAEKSSKTVPKDKETNLLIQYKDSVETDDEAIESRESEKDSKSYLLPNAVKNQYIKVSPL